MADYIHNDLLVGFRNKNDGFNYTKLLSLLEELNDNYAKRNRYASSMLIRAILDHIPPLLGYTTFDAVANNYPWSPTDKRYMKGLLDFRNEADDALHALISNEQDFLEMDSLPNGNRVNTLLQECLKKNGQFQPQTITLQNANHSTAHPSGINISLTKNEVAWANWGVSRYRYSAFQVKLTIDNYKSNNPDYIKASIRAKTSDGMWEAKHFIFAVGRFDTPVDPDEELRVEAKTIKKIAVLVSDYLVVNAEVTESMPDIDRDTMEIIIETKSGKILPIPVKAGWIKKQ